MNINNLHDISHLFFLDVEKCILWHLTMSRLIDVFILARWMNVSV